jgi:hypothetical protein
MLNSHVLLILACYEIIKKPSPKFMFDLYFPLIIEQYEFSKVNFFFIDKENTKDF